MTWDPDPLVDEQTRDDLDVGWGEVPSRDDDERIWQDVPPHHGRY